MTARLLRGDDNGFFRPAVQSRAKQPSCKKAAKKNSNKLDLGEAGIQLALEIKHDYQEKTPLCLPGDNTRLLTPEIMVNLDLDVEDYASPLPLAMMATRDPESPMALAALSRLAPLGRTDKFASGIYQVVGESSKHPLVKKCVELVTENDFSPSAINLVRTQTQRFILRTRKQFTQALRANMYALMEGSLAPRSFIHEFFELTEAGNLRNDIRQKLVVTLILSETVRPSVKFLMLENFERLPKPVRLGIIAAVLKAKRSHHTDVIKEELRWIVTQNGNQYGIH